MPYVIRRTSKGGGWVTEGQASYTGKLQHAKQYPTREAAEADHCPQNETVERLEDAR